MESATRARSIGVMLASFGLLAIAYTAFTGDGNVTALLGSVFTVGGSLLAV